jgi:uncharacterized protein (DUF1697 family)
MDRYIALLRGINVGGKNKILMADLGRTFASIGLVNVQTYMQSGNVIFDSTESEEALVPKIENRIRTDFGFFVSVIIRTADEFAKLICNCPFSEEEISKAESLSAGESLYVLLLGHPPAEDKINLLAGFNYAQDRYKIVGRDVYLLLCGSIRNSKLANDIGKLNVPATTRNWKTIRKLCLIAREIPKTV